MTTTNEKDAEFEATAQARIIKVKFREAAICLLMNEVRAVVLHPKYDECSISEVLGVLELLKAELIARNV
jgi:hypothetical protein